MVHRAVLDDIRQNILRLKRIQQTNNFQTDVFFCFRNVRQWFSTEATYISWLHVYVLYAFRRNRLFQLMTPLSFTKIKKKVGQPNEVIGSFEVFYVKEAGMSSQRKFSFWFIRDKNWWKFSVLINISLWITNLVELTDSFTNTKRRPYVMLFINSSFSIAVIGRDRSMLFVCTNTTIYLLIRVVMHLFCTIIVFPSTDRQ